ncbi:MAG: hypothetical protein HUJ60_03455, partial [Bacilli bacterium]|nr:hypothetical protein [Bacilli bacterium]
MPHSSGGGSCGGGTHGGSSSSSSSGSHGTRNYKYSSRAFPGATRYTYVDSRGRFRSFYANQDPATAVTSGPLIYGLLGFFFLLPIGIVLLTGIHNPKKLEISYDNKILIDDRAGVLSETEKTRLTGTFRDFYDESGVTPSFFTVLDSEWKENHASLEGYAFKEYVKSFDDECHWLFVYSVNDGEPAWSFEGMQGDDTDKVLDTVFTSDFNTRLYDALMDESLTVGEAVDKTFSDSVHTVMNFRFGVEPFEWIIV